MDEIAKHTDLTKLESDPGPRAEFTPVLEQVDMGLKLPGGSELKIATNTRSALMLVCSITTLLLVIAGGVAGGAVLAAGAPVWAAIAVGLVIPPVNFTLLYLVFRQNR